MLLRMLAAGSLAALGFGSLASAPRQSPAVRTATLQVGDMAPDFTLKDQENKPVKLSDFRGKQAVVLAFYPMAFTSG